VKRVFLILFILVILIWSSLHIKSEINHYQLEVQRMQLEVEMLRLEQQEMAKQIRSFLDKWNIAVMEP
jgi:hypothetical protein